MNFNKYFEGNYVKIIFSRLMWTSSRFMKNFHLNLELKYLYYVSLTKKKLTI